MSTNEHDLRFRPLGVEDLELLLAWRSNPRIYRHFRDQDGPLKWSEHVEWFANRPDGRHDFVILYRGRRIGTVSLGEEGSVGVLVGEEASWGRGIAKAAVEWVCGEFADGRTLLAEVRVDNERSQKLFEGCGFTQQGRDGQWLLYEFSG